MLDKLIVKFSGVLVPPRLRKKLLNGRIGKVSEKRERINSNCYFKGKHINIDDGVFINVFCKFFSHEDSTSFIDIQKNAVLGMEVTVITHTHEQNSSERRADNTIFRPVIICEGS